jgi:hypothetical protein
VFISLNQSEYYYTKKWGLLSIVFFSIFAKNSEKDGFWRVCFFQSNAQVGPQSGVKMSKKSQKFAKNRKNLQKIAKMNRF